MNSRGSQQFLSSSRQLSIQLAIPGMVTQIVFLSGKDLVDRE